ncbi:TonB-dependent receptor domain-containing protein [Endozoicomonas montiporae]|uniref:Ligand-gated TonB-dependent outer membrane channel n=1 Tax=Endozoicomonas montiporae CL-33 TaxID=570277 RepID=A0A142BGQ4_9GAMM|nr:TonB-dependent receptor [Endozoicomonas montiporae]AMO57930.1 ligand-gated TonB-dependent outer membrane channel [Endozoicomonas montiporae CL-33]
MSYKLQAAIGVAVAGFVNASVATDDVYRLDDVVVTASRTAQTVDQALAPVTVITREEIERSQASSVVELLNKTPGMQMATSGGPGSSASVFLRGTKTGQTLVLLDGQKINSTSMNVAPLQYIDPDMIERIEVVRGPKSSLYGADAMGGVIQIFTRQGYGKPRLRLKAGIGTHGTGEYNANYSGEHNGYRFNLGANFYETQGYDHTDSKIGRDGDDDGYRNKSISGSVSKQFESGLDAGVSVYHTEGKAEYDHNHNGWGDLETKPYNDFSVTSLNSHLMIPVNEVWSTRLEAGYIKEDAFRREEGRGEDKLASFAKGRRYSASWQNDVEWQESQLLTAGLDYSYETIDTGTKYPEDNRYNYGVFAQQLSSFESSDLQIGLRHDKNETYGNKTTGNIAWGFDLPYNLRLIPSYGTAFRAPTFSDLYFPGSGNPNLKPEKSENFEVELKGKFKTISWSASIFRNNIDDMFLYVSKPTDDNEFAGHMENVEKARITGFEFAASTRIEGWDVNANITLLDPENRTKNKVLERRAKQLINLDADRRFGKFNVGGTIRGQGRTYNDVNNNQELAGFMTVDLRGGYQISSELKTEFKLTNLLDKQYTTTLGYKSEPFNGMLSLIWTPEL